MFRVLQKASASELYYGLLISPLGSLSISSPQSCPCRYQTCSSKSAATFDHLVRSYGFSPDSAFAISTLIKERGANNYDSVLALFTNHGFSPETIAQIVTKHPFYLCSVADKYIKPKLEFFCGKGVSCDTLALLVSNDPIILRRSLNKKLIPCFNYLVSFFGNQEAVLNLFMAKRGTKILHMFTESLDSNINTLRGLGVPVSYIVKTLTLRPRTLCRDAHEFRQIAGEVKQLGLDPSSLMFIHGLGTFAGMKRDKWDSKMAVFQRFGWSENKARALFVKQPKIMESSVEKLEKILVVLVDEMGLTAHEISNFATVLLASLKGRVLPRARILSFLLSEQILSRKSVGSFFLKPERDFLESYLLPHAAKFPHLMEIYIDDKASPRSIPSEDNIQANGEREVLR